MRSRLHLLELSLMIPVLAITGSLLNAGTTWHVAANGLDTNNGLGWGTPLATLSNALKKATSDNDDIILVSNGVYAITQQLDVDKGVVLKGIGGYESTVITRDLTATCRVMKVSHANAWVEGFTLTNGLIVNASYYKLAGAGLWLTAGIVSNCLVIGNSNLSGGDQGGGVYMSDGLLTDSIVSSNRAPAGRCYGGGIAMVGGTVTRCVIEKNFGGGSDDGLGGGVFMLGGVLSNCVIQLNAASGTYGGGVAMGGGNAYVGAGLLVDCTIQSNNSTKTPCGLLVTGTGIVQNCTIASHKQAQNAVEIGGGLLTNCTIAANSISGIGMYQYAPGTTSLVTHCTIAGNSGGGVRLNNMNASFPALATISYRNCIISSNAPGGPGVHFVGNPPNVAATFENCVIVTNGYGSSDWGCGIYLAGANATNILFRNCLIANNKSGYNQSAHGGGVTMLAGVLDNCTIVSNQAGKAGGCGGIYYTGGAITNSIIYYNLSSGGAVSNLAGAGVADACVNSCSPTLTNTENGNITGAPLFVDLANRDYRLGTGSLCIAAGLYEPWMDTAKDLAGKARIQGGAVDIGAYEYETPKPSGSLMLIR